MRLRLFERLGRLVGWLFDSQGDNRSRGTRSAGTEASGRHRRNVGGGQQRDRAAVATGARSAAAPPLQPPAVLPRRDPRSPGLAPRPRTTGPRITGPRTGAQAMPPLPSPREPNRQPASRPSRSNRRSRILGLPVFPRPRPDYSEWAGYVTRGDRPLLNMQVGKMRIPDTRWFAGR